MPGFAERRRASIENELVRVTVLHGGGHIAEITHKSSGVNPLWVPPWPSIEPSAYNRAKHPEYGDNSESRLLAGIMGHNLCLDFFGAPSEEEYAAGLSVHGEASVVPYEIETAAGSLTMHADFPVAQLRFTRRIELRDHAIAFTERVENLSAADRPAGWTEHVTLGPPFLEKGATQFRASATRSMDMETGAEFEWPRESVYTSAPASGGFTTHLMDTSRERAYFTAWSPASRIALGYLWRRSDFPWLGIWEENYSRIHPPWNGRTLTRGMEFGVSPIPESRRKMIDRGSLFGAPGYRWIPARSAVEVNYYAAISERDRVPGELSVSRSGEVRFGDS